MSVEIITSGASQNSYISLAEAQALLLTMAASFQTGEADELADGDQRFLIEAASDLNLLWDWAGDPTDPAQVMAWPRSSVTKPGYRFPAEPGWTLPYSYGEFIYYKSILASGFAADQFIPSDQVPTHIKEAQALLAVLKKQGSNLVGDNQGDLQGTQIGKLKLSYVNAVRESADIHKRTGQYGRFKAGLLTGV